MGKVIDRTHRELTNEDRQKIVSTYHSWKSENSDYQDVKGFCKSASLEEVAENNYVLTPGRYVGIEVEMLDDEEFEEKIERLTSELAEQFRESKELETKIKANLEKVGFKMD